MAAENSVITRKEDWDGEHCLLCGAVIPPARSKSVVKMFCRAPHRSLWHKLRREQLLQEIKGALETANRAIHELVGG